MRINDNKNTEGIILIGVSLFLGGLFVYFTLTDKTSRDLLVSSYRAKEFGLFPVLWFILVFVTGIVFPVFGFLQVGKEHSLEFCERTGSFTWHIKSRKSSKTVSVASDELRIKDLSYFWFMDGILIPYRIERTIIKSHLGCIHLPRDEVGTWTEIVIGAQPVAGTDVAR